MRRWIHISFRRTESEVFEHIDNLQSSASTFVRIEKLSSTSAVFIGGFTYSCMHLNRLVVNFRRSILRPKS